MSLSTLSALADRIKIARQGRGIDINLSIQYILNCGDAGTCWGGDHFAVYHFVFINGFVPFDSCMPYQACSSDSKEGSCGLGQWRCSAINTCRTCSNSGKSGSHCAPIHFFPNASISQFGSVSGEDQMMSEIFARGPIACHIASTPLHHYTRGILDAPNATRLFDHVISVYGWGIDSVSGKKFWRIRNSCGEYTGEMGHVRLVRGENQLGVEKNCVWASPATWSESNLPCYEDGSKCLLGPFVDPSTTEPWHFKYLKNPETKHEL